METYRSLFFYKEKSSLSSSEGNYSTLLCQTKYLLGEEILVVLLFGAQHIPDIDCLLQSLDQSNFLSFGFENWRPTLYAYLFWAFCLCLGQVILYGEQGKRRLFILPAVLFVISVVIFPLIFALGIAFSSWNLSSPDGRQFNGLANVYQMWSDPFYWNALKNMIYYTLHLVEYVIALV